MKTNVNTVLRRVIEDKIKLKRKFKKKNGYYLYCPGSLRPDGKAVEMFRTNLIPGRPHDDLVVLRETLINEAIGFKDPNKEDLDARLAKAGMSWEELNAWLDRKGAVRALVTAGISFGEAWRKFLEHQVLEDEGAMPSLQTAERVYRQFDIAHPKLALIELWDDPKKVETFIKTTWAKPSQGAMKSLFTTLMDWARKHLTQLYPNVVAAEELFQADPRKLIEVAARGKRPRAILSVEGLNQLIDEAMTNPRDEKYRPSFFLDFETFARPSTEASGGSTDAVRIYDDLALLTVEKIITSQGSYGDEISPDGYGYIDAPLNKTRMKRNGNQGRKTRMVNITPRARAYLQPILQPMIDAGWTHQSFISETATNYSMAKSRLFKQIDPMVWVEGIPNPLRYSKAKKIANTNDIVRSTVVTFLLLVLRHYKLIKEEDIMDHLRRQMGHTGDSQTMEEFYLSNGRLLEALAWWKHRPPPFTYTLDHQQFRKYRYGTYLKASAAAKPINAELIKDPKHVAKIIRNRRKARKIDPKTGKFTYRRKTAISSSSPSVASDPITNADQVLLTVKHVEDEQKLQHDSSRHNDEVPSQSGNGAPMDSVRPDPISATDETMPPL